MDQISFKDKVVIVTGASSGIGAAAAKLFAEYGAALTLVGRDQLRLNDVAVECESKHDLKPLCVCLDLTNVGTCEFVINRTIEQYNRIDVIVNCAGKLKISSLYDQSMEILDELLDINLRVPYRMALLALPHLAKTKGNIVNIGFSLAKRYRPGFLPYILTKSAVECFSKHAAAELATEGVRVNVISPGVARTNILQNLNIDRENQPCTYRRIAEQMPNKTIVEPKEVAILICLAASGLFPNLNGSNFVIDGGFCMV